MMRGGKYMLDSLGLGIVLSMQDNFTPQANRAVQSMNRMTTSAEKMERDMQRSMNNLQNIMLAGFSLNQVGGEFERAGKKILGTFAGITREIVAVNSAFDTMKAQYKTVFGDMAKQKMEWAMDFSIKTPFQVAETSRLMQMMKYQGIDVTKQFQTAGGEMKSLIEYMGDFSTKNMQQGIEGLAYAISNGLGGNWRSLRMRFDMTKQQVDRLKNALASGGQDNFLREFTKLADEITPNAMKNMLGTWGQIMAEMEDTWQVFVYKVGEAGAFDPIKRTLVAVSNMLTRIAGNKDDIQNIADVIKDLWKPVDLVARGFISIVESTTKFALEHPNITKMVAGFMAFNGVMLVLSGTVMKTFGSFLILSTAITSAVANLKVLNTLPTVNAFSGLNLKIGSVIRGLGMFGVMAGVAGLAFKNNVGGMRDKLSNFMDKWGVAKEALDIGFSEVTKGSGAIFSQQLDSHVKKLMRIQTVGKLLFKTVFGKMARGELDLTKKELQNVRALGLAPLARTLGDIREGVVNFAKGMEQGLLTAYKIAKEFLDFVLLPIKTVMETISESSTLKSLGLSGDESDSRADKLQKMGKLVGTVVGGLMGLKIVKSLSKVILSPFKGLLGMLTKTRVASDSLKRSLRGIGGATTVGYSAINPATGASVGKYNSLRGRFSRVMHRGREGKARIRNFLNQRSELPETQSSRIKGFDKVKNGTAPTNFTEFMMARGADKNGLYTKKSPKLMRALFGTKYYNMNGDGTSNYLGRYGGRLMENRDDFQLRLATEKNGVRPPSLQDLHGRYGGNTEAWLRDRGRFIRQDQSIGDISDIRGSRHSNLIQSLQNSRERAINNLTGDSNWRSQAYRNAGIDGRTFNADPEARARFLREQASNDPSVRRANSQLRRARGLAGNNPIYAEERNTRFKRVKQALFGQRIYTPELDGQGRYHERTVARRGGLFRRASNDMVFRDRGDLSLRGRLGRIGSAVGNTAVGQISKGLFNDLRSSTSGVMNTVRMAGAGMMSRAGNTRVGGFLGKVRRGVGRVAGAPRGFINNQRARLGLAPITRGSTRRGLMRGTGRGLLGGAKLAGKGVFKGAKLAGRGAVKGVKFAGRAGKGLLRGAGRMGMGMLSMLSPALMLGSLGKMGFDAIASKGGGTGIDSFNKGMDKLTKKVKGLDFAEVFNKGLKSGKSMFKSIGRFGVQVFKGLQKSMPSIISKAWTGIKGMAGLAWTWIKENGMSTLTSFANYIKPVLGGIWTTLKKWAGLAWDWITTDGMSKLTTLVGRATEWLIGSGVPMLIRAIKGFGIWLITTGFPNLLGLAVGLAKSIGKGMWNGITGALSGVGTAIGNIMVGGLRGTIKALLPKPLEKPVLKALGLKYHHGGLWMSPNEHTAVIRKDETVLPPEKSKRLDYLLDTVENGRKTRSTGNDKGQVDNSVNIDKVQVVVQADKLSRADARNQAKMILEEIKKMGKEQEIREYS